MKARLAERAAQKPPAELSRIDELKSSPYIEQRAQAPAVPAAAPAAPASAPAAQASAPAAPASAPAVPAAVPAAQASAPTSKPAAASHAPVSAPPEAAPSAPAPTSDRMVDRRAPTLPEIQPSDDLAAAAEAWLGASSESPALGALAAALPGRPDTAGLRAALLAENARRAHAGLRAPFVFRFDGHVGLSSASLTARYLELERRILTSMAEQREIVRRELLGRVGQLTDVAFEQVVLDLLARLGFGDVRIVHRNRGTLLVFGRHVALGGTATAMVVRRSAAEIGAETLDALRGALEDLDATHGLILTAGTFSSDARTSAVDTDEAPVTLIDGAGFARLMYEHGLGVAAHAPVLRYVDAAFFDSLG